MLGVFAPLGNWIGTALASLFMMVYNSNFIVKLIGYIFINSFMAYFNSFCRYAFTYLLCTA